MGTNTNKKRPGNRGNNDISFHCVDSFRLKLEALQITDMPMNTFVKEGELYKVDLPSAFLVNIHSRKTLLCLEEVNGNSSISS